MINAIVKDWPAEVPNPYTLLTNVPPDAKFFTVIDLCSAFFSVPLAEESQYLFAFTYRGKKYTYTRLPQGFKHSPHVLTQVLGQELEGLALNGTLLHCRLSFTVLTNPGGLPSRFYEDPPEAGRGKIQSFKI